MKNIAIIIGAVAILGSVALAADQKKMYEEKPYDYGATPSPAAPAPTPAPATPAAPEAKAAQPAPAVEQQQFNYKPPKQEQKIKAKPKQKRERKLAHRPGGRKPFNYDIRFIDKAKLDRCIKELPWKGLLKEHDSPAKRKEFCQTYQIEIWSNEDQKKVKNKLKNIFEAKPRTQSHNQPWEIE